MNSKLCPKYQCVDVADVREHHSFTVTKTNETLTNDTAFQRPYSI